jgi:hypothetical protein
MRVSLIVLAFVFVTSVSAQEAKGPLAQKKDGPEQAKEMTKLLKARVALAQKAYDATEKSFGEVRRIGAVNILTVKPEESYTWSVRWLKAERDINPKGAEYIVALEAHLKRMKALETKTMSLVPGILPQTAAFEVEWYRLEAELWLIQAKAK